MASCRRPRCSLSPVRYTARMTLRALQVWFALLVAAFLNGTFREVVLAPRFGVLRSNQFSVVLLCILILVIAFASIRWIAPATIRDAATIGGLWLVLTLIFEFGFGRLRGTPWSVLLHDYNLLAGRLWIFVLVVTLAAPYVAMRARHVAG